MEWQVFYGWKFNANFKDSLKESWNNNHFTIVLTLWPHQRHEEELVREVTSPADPLPPSKDTQNPLHPETEPSWYRRVCSGWWPRNCISLLRTSGKNDGPSCSQNTQKAFCQADPRQTDNFTLKCGSQRRKRKRQPLPVFLPGESCGQRRLVCHSPRGCTQLDMTEHMHMRAHTENQFLFKSLWLINVEGMTELENYHFPSPSGTNDWFK